MSFNSSSDFLALLRVNNSAGLDLLKSPMLDSLIQTLSDAGLLVFSVSPTAPSSNQDTTMWLQLESPSYAGPGTLYLWNGSAYVLATPGLFWRYLVKSAKAAGLTTLSTFTFNANASLTTNYDESLFTNTGAGGSVTLLMPAVAEASLYTFVKTVNQAFIIGMPAGVTADYGGTLTSAGGSLTSGPVGSTITLRGTNGLYYASAATGNWTTA
jgi:hypothetical protein